MASSTRICVSVAALCFLMSIVHGSMPGGVMEEKPADEDVAKALADPEVKKAFKATAELGGKNSKFNLIPVSYATQVVAGTNYFIKVRIGNTSQYFHVRIFEDFSGNYSVANIQFGKKVNDPVVYFDSDRHTVQNRSSSPK